MKLIIDIPEEVKNRLCFGVTYQKDIQTVCEALNNGTPIPDNAEPCDDAISRQAAISIVENMYGLARVDLLFNAVKQLKELSSVRPQEKTGHWIKIKPYPLQMHDYECSECYHETDDNTEDYCSGCGARMESEYT